MIQINTASYVFLNNYPFGLNSNKFSLEDLKNVISSEKDIIKIKDIYDQINGINKKREFHLNEMESKLIVRGALLTSELSTQKINEYLRRLDTLADDFDFYLKQKKIPTQNKEQILTLIHHFIYKKYFYVEDNHFNKLDITLDTGKAGCNSLTTLVNFLAVRNGIEIQTVKIPGHVFSLYKNRSIENTAATGINNISFKPHQISSAFGVVSSHLNNRGAHLEQKKEYDQAIKYLKQAIELDPNDSNSYYNLGLVYYRKKEYDQSLKHYLKAIELAPDCAEFYNGAAIVYEMQQEHEKAEAYYLKAIELNPEFCDAKENLEGLLRKRKN